MMVMNYTHLLIFYYVPSTVINALHMYYIIYVYMCILNRMQLHSRYYHSLIYCEYFPLSLNTF